MALDISPSDSEYKPLSIGGYLKLDPDVVRGYEQIPHRCFSFEDAMGLAASKGKYLCILYAPMPDQVTIMVLGSANKSTYEEYWGDRNARFYFGPATVVPESFFTPPKKEPKPATPTTTGKSLRQWLKNFFS